MSGVTLLGARTRTGSEQDDLRVGQGEDQSDLGLDDLGLGAPAELDDRADDEAALGGREDVGHLVEDAGRLGDGIVGEQDPCR